MRRTIIFWLAMSCIPIFGFSQTTQEFDFVSPFHEEVAAVKKGDQWGFINRSGDMIIDFRKDLVITKTSKGEYPIFMNEMCLIFKKEKDIKYFGYINNLGKTVIEPVYLNATNFEFDYALALKLRKEIAGHNHLLNKDVVYYTYEEVIIDKKGDVLEKLTEAKNVVLMKKMLPEPPGFTSKILSNHLATVKDSNGKWTIKRFREADKTRIQ